MERLLSVEPRLTLEFLRESRHVDIVRMCKANKIIRKMCNSPQGRVLMRDKEATESFIVYGRRLGSYHPPYGIQWLLQWKGAEIYNLQNKPTEIESLEGATDAYSEKIFRMVYRLPRRGRGALPSPSQELLEECIREPRLTLSFTGLGTSEDSTTALGQACYFAADSACFAQLLSIREHMLDVRPTGQQTLVMVHLSWERWNRYWKRGISRRIRIRYKGKNPEEPIFRELWPDG